MTQQPRVISAPLRDLVPDAPLDTDLVNVKINGRPVKVPKSYSVLDACRKFGFYVPTVCYHPRMKPLGRCKICVVEMEDTGNFSMSCSTQVEEGMAIRTDSTKVRAKQAEVMRELKDKQTQEAQPAVNLDQTEFDSLVEWTENCEVESNGAITIDPALCVQCGRCSAVCSSIQNMDILEIPPNKAVRPAGGLHLRQMPCIACGQCASYCPTGAIAENSHVDRVYEALAAGKVMIVQTAPSVRVGLGEEVGMKPGGVTTGKMVASLRQLGFKYVVDTNFAADLTIMEEGNELIQRLTTAWTRPQESVALPMFTSCCPAWINFVEQEAPDFIPNLSSCKSPQQMQAALIKTYFAKKIGCDARDIFSCSVMPCTAKKQEIDRQHMGRDGLRDVDAVLTVRELGKLIRKHHIQFNHLEDSEFDNPLGESTGAAILFGATGGVMEAALRTAYEVVSGNPLPTLSYGPVRGFKEIKEATVQLPLKGTGEVKTLRIAVCSGIKHARAFLERLRNDPDAPEYHFVEVMSCPGGCIGGGGMPKSLNPNILERRMEAIYSTDESSKIRRSHENPMITAVYDDFLGKPLGHKSHELLHTHYYDRSSMVARPVEEVIEEDETPGDGVPLTIVYATQTGNSQAIAQRIANEARNKSIEFAVTLRAVNKINPASLPAAGLLVYVTSTFGMGEHPDTAQAFYEWLSNSSNADNMFEKLRFGVFGIGSSSYTLFCQAAKEVDERLHALGGKRLLPMGTGDENHSEKFEGGLGPWLEALWDSLGASDVTGNQVPEAKFCCVRTLAMQTPLPPPPGFQFVELSHSERIVPEDVPREARKFHFELEGTTLSYETGYHIAILPRNLPAIVARFLKTMSLDGDMCITVRPTKDTDVPSGLSKSLTVREIFEQYLDLCGRASKVFLKGLIPFAADPAERARLEHLISKEGKDDFVKSIIQECVPYYEVFEMFPSIRPSLDYLVEFIPEQKPRLYSIASSHLLHEQQIQLVIGIVDWKTPSGVTREGLCTNYLRSLDVADKPMVAVTIKSSPLQPPKDPKAPIIAVGLGSGMAPFRSFLQHREALHRKGVELGPMTFYFGCRRRNEDALCLDELLKWEEMGIHKLVPAYSREQAKKVYVTDRMRENPDVIGDFLGRTDGFLGYCGPAGRVPSDIISIVKASMSSECGISEDQAEKRWEYLSDNGLICIEAW